MKRSTSWILTALLGGAFAAGMFWLLVEHQAAPARLSRELVVSRPSIASPKAPLPVVGSTPKVEIAAALSPTPNNSASTIPRRPQQSLSLTHLQSEMTMLADVEGRQGMNVRSTGLLMRSNQFSEFMDQLGREAKGSPLALDLADLYTRSANEANATVDNALALRVVCGMSICVLSATAPSKEVFDAWFAAFLDSPSARHYSAGRHDKLLDDGTVEYRVVFSNDPDRRSAINPSR
ncbi:MAG: hypothetical protein ABI650_03670 [Dokdonella sp.]